MVTDTAVKELNLDYYKLRLDIHNTEIELRACRDPFIQILLKDTWLQLKDKLRIYNEGR